MVCEVGGGTKLFVRLALKRRCPWSSFGSGRSTARDTVIRVKYWGVLLSDTSISTGKSLGIVRGNADSPEVKKK